jgi:cysteine desulfurase/selenocysteine lyase
MSSLPEHAAVPYDVEKTRRDFPILQQKVYGKPLVYLDNAATAQKPQAVIDAVAGYYKYDNANIHRGVHALSMRSTEAFEGVREKVRGLLNARDASEIVFVRGATEGVNLVKGSWGRANVREGDEIVVTALEHHSNIVPWQLLCQATGAKLRVVPMNHDGELLVDEYEGLFNERTRIVGITHVSNALGTVNPVKEMIAIAHGHGVPVLVDGAQAVPHLTIDVQDLDADFYVFSGHKVFAPNGVGALYVRRSILETMPPYQGGGDMIASVTFEKTEYNVVPHKFEAGTPNIAGAIGLGAAIDYVESIGMDRIAAYEDEIVSYAVEAVGSVDGVRIIGAPAHRAGVVSFLIGDVHPHDVGTILDREGIAIRAGHHCSQPVMDFYGVPATCRASFALYNTKDEVDALVAGIQKVKEVFG